MQTKPAHAATQARAPYAHPQSESISEASLEVLIDEVEELIAQVHTAATHEQCAAGRQIARLQNGKCNAGVRCRRGRAADK